MPLYEYHCKGCNSVFEKLVTFAEASRMPVCPVCRSLETEKKVSKIAASTAASGTTGSASNSSCGRGGFR